MILKYIPRVRDMSGGDEESYSAGLLGLVEAVRTIESGGYAGEPEAYVMMVCRRHIAEAKNRDRQVVVPRTSFRRGARVNTSESAQLVTYDPPFIDWDYYVRTWREYVVLDMRASGYTLKEIGGYLGVTKSTVLNILARIGARVPAPDPVSTPKPKPKPKPVHRVKGIVYSSWDGRKWDDWEIECPVCGVVTVTCDPSYYCSCGREVGCET